MLSEDRGDQPGAFGPAPLAGAADAMCHECSPRFGDGRAVRDQEDRRAFWGPLAKVAKLAPRPAVKLGVNWPPERTRRNMREVCAAGVI
ncbi:hypothetical protein JCM4914_33550 [Streptomyces platensis subsp. malvinus]